MSFFNRKAVQHFVGRLPRIGELVFTLDPTTVQIQLQPTSQLGLVHQYFCKNSDYYSPPKDEYASSAERLGRLLNRDLKKYRCAKANNISLWNLEIEVGIWFGEEQKNLRVQTIGKQISSMGGCPCAVFLDLNENKYFDDGDIENFARLGYFGDKKERLRIHELMVKMARDMGVDWICYTQTQRLMK